MQRIARITECRVGFRLLAMTVVFDDFRTENGAYCIVKIVIASRKAAWQSVPWHPKDAITRRAISPTNRNFLNT